MKSEGNLKSEGNCNKNWEKIMLPYPMQAIFTLRFAQSREIDLKKNFWG
jgi:hypothetical protein